MDNISQLMECWLVHELVVLFFTGLCSAPKDKSIQSNKIR